MKKLFLIDAYALIFKYYYAFMGRPMRNRAGMNTSVVFGFTKFLRDIQKREHPDLLGVAFDPKGGSFRRAIYPEYKANRAETPEDILLSVPYVKRVLDAMCIPVLEVAGYEADDVIGTLAKKGAAAGYEVYMVTPDKDYGQLVDDRCRIYKQKGDGIEVVDRAAIEAKYGIADPVLVRDILALWGDASDNIPGVPASARRARANWCRRGARRKTSSTMRATSPARRASGSPPGARNCCWPSGLRPFVSMCPSPSARRTSRSAHPVSTS